MVDKIKGILLDAVYVDKDLEVALYIETAKGKCQARIPRSQIATFGDRTEEDISMEMNRYVDILKHKFLGKEITIVSDTNLEQKIEDGYQIRY